ncbi:hypothetical protein [Dysosmobacter sp.]
MNELKREWEVFKKLYQDPDLRANFNALGIVLILLVLCALVYSSLIWF